MKPSKKFVKNKKGGIVSRGSKLDRIVYPGHKKNKNYNTVLIKKL